MNAPAKLKHLHESERAVLDEWGPDVASRDGKQGLWVVGHRRQGSSYIAEAAFRGIIRADLERFELAHHRVEAIAVEESIRKLWSAEGQVRNSGDDYQLWGDMHTLEIENDFMWNECPILWIDDLHEAYVDGPFWMKHVMKRIESRLKNDLPTLVATDMDPSHQVFGSLSVVIEDLFHVVAATGHWRAER